MSSFLSSSQLANLTGTFQRHFETFSTGISNYITVYKVPTEVINNSSSVNFPGYGPDNNGSQTDITYIENSRTIGAQIIYPKDTKSLAFAQIRTNIDINDLVIKVSESDASYINNGKTERILVNGSMYNLKSSVPNVQNYFGLKFYYYQLGVTT